MAATVKRKKTKFSSQCTLFQPGQLSNFQAPQVYTYIYIQVWVRLGADKEKAAQTHCLSSKGFLTVISLEIHLFVKLVPGATKHPQGLRMEVKHLMHGQILY